MDRLALFVKRLSFTKKQRYALHCVCLSVLSFCGHLWLKTESRRKFKFDAHQGSHNNCFCGYAIIAVLAQRSKVEVIKVNSDQIQHPQLLAI